MVQLESAPLADAEKSQAFRPTTKGRMAFSHSSFEIGMYVPAASVKQKSIQSIA